MTSEAAKSRVILDLDLDVTNSLTLDVDFGGIHSVTLPGLIDFCFMNFEIKVDIILE